jgi:hypothetical protein
MHQALIGAAMIGARPAPAAPAKLGIPGLYRGRVVAVRHPGSIVSGAYQAEPVRQMMHKGMLDLTGAPGWPDAWRVLFQPGDVVGIKVSPVGGRRLCSDAIVLHQIIDGLQQAGVRPRDIVVFNRYRQEILECGIQKWLPPGVRWGWAAEVFEQVQLGMEGYDPDQYLDLPLCQPGQNIDDDHMRRSYVAEVVSKQINKLVNLPVLKNHSSAGVTIALKNISCGMVNNVCRIHTGKTLNATGVFIPAVVNLKPIREKTVLHIVDGVKALYNGGPGGNPKYVWEHATMYFGTDPVALDKTGLRVINAKRKEVGMPPVADPNADRADDGGPSHACRVDHVEIAGAIGLGEFDDSKIDLRKHNLG